MVQNEKVKVGQIWESMDPRAVGRRFRIMNVEKEFVVVSNKAGRWRKIRLDRMVPDNHGYRLVPSDELSR